MTGSGICRNQRGSAVRGPRSVNARRGEGNLGGAVTFGIRPEHLALVTSGGYPATVVVTEPTGSETHFVFDLAGQDIVGVQEPHQSQSRGCHLAELCAGQGPSVRHRCGIQASLANAGSLVTWSSRVWVQPVGTSTTPNSKTLGLHPLVIHARDMCFRYDHRYGHCDRRGVEVRF